MKTKPVQLLTALTLIICVAAGCGHPPKEPLDYISEGGIRCGLRSPGMLRGDWYLALEFSTTRLANTEKAYAAYSYKTSPKRLTLPFGKVPKDTKVCRGELVSDGRAYNGSLEIYRRHN